MLRGYTLPELRELLTQGGSLATLPPKPSQPEASGTGPGPRDRSSLPLFSLEELHNRLVAFIVADDQVRFLLVIFYAILRHFDCRTVPKRCGM
jgi:hypothetical protein